MTESFETVLLDVDETTRVATITLNRPEQLNAFNRTMCEEMAGVWRTVNNGTTWTPVFDTQGSYSIGTVTIDPKNADRYFVTDGQKDIAACFERQTSRVIAALKYDWMPNVRNLADGWQKGGVLKISKIYPDAKTGNYDYLGTKGQKIEWEMVPMGELFVEEGTIPGDDVHGLAGADGTIWHPTGRWASTVIGVIASSK